MKNFITLIILTILPFFVGVNFPANEAPPKSFGTIYPGHLDGPFTGGFGEQTCHSCHFDYDINYERGSLTVDGIPNRYKPGKKYNIKIHLQSEHLEIGGFQMTSRFVDGSQAGEFEWEGDRLMYTPQISDEVKYLQHTLKGTTPDSDWEICWEFTWNAPGEPRDSVVFNIAANAGNYDDSAFGDWIYVQELTSVYSK